MDKSHLLDNTVNHLEMHPQTGSALTVLHVLAAYIFKIVDNGRINPLVMDCFQILAWTIAILCGIITIIGVIKKAVTRWHNRRVERAAKRLKI